MTTERERFEGWIKSIPVGQGYNAFEAWQASRASLLGELEGDEVVEKVARAISLEENYRAKALTAIAAIKKILGE